ncbi:hypothetical protein B0H19DRAFT_1244664 [Mycena capillaripes]|nr:hypothetical protein B0H19DRAFT_1244664 [Mycena capillaripes]
MATLNLWRHFEGLDTVTERPTETTGLQLEIELQWSSISELGVAGSNTAHRSHSGDFLATAFHRLIIYKKKQAHGSIIGNHQRSPLLQSSRILLNLEKHCPHHSLAWSTLHLRFRGIGHNLSRSSVWWRASLTSDLALQDSVLCPSSFIMPAERKTPLNLLRRVVYAVFCHYSDRLRYLELEMSQVNLRQLGLGYTELPKLEIATRGCTYATDSDVSPIQIFNEASQFHDHRLGSS